MTSAFLLMFTAIGFNGIAQVLLKMGAASRKNQAFWDPYLNRYSVSGYCLYLASTLFLLYALEDIPLKMFAALSSLSFIIVFLLSAIILREKITLPGIIAILLICAGVTVFNVP